MNSFKLGDKIRIVYGENGRFGVVIEDDKEPLFYFDKQVVCLKELSPRFDDCYNIRLVVCLNDKDNLYYMEEVLIDVECRKYAEFYYGVSNTLPVWGGNDLIRMNKPDNGELVLHNFKTNRVCSLQEDIVSSFKKNGLKVSDIRLDNLELENGSKRFDLSICMGELEVLHLCLVEDSDEPLGFRILNYLYIEIFYSGMGFKATALGNSNDLIDYDNFICELMNNPIVYGLIEGTLIMRGMAQNDNGHFRIRSETLLPNRVKVREEIYEVFKKISIAG